MTQIIMQTVSCVKQEKLSIMEPMRSMSTQRSMTGVILQI